jgi:hypothetical protein
MRQAVRDDKEGTMIRWLLAGVILLVLAGVAIPAAACCDWTARDTAFWQQMSENPRKFTFDLEARPSPYRLVVKDRELRVGPDGADWHEVHHALVGGQPTTAPDPRGGRLPGAAPQNAASPAK